MQAIVFALLLTSLLAESTDFDYADHGKNWLDSDCT
jgi:hypothetical protein